MMTPDNARPEDIEPEPEGFWDSIHEQVRVWLDDYADDVLDPSAD